MYSGIMTMEKLMAGINLPKEGRELVTSQQLTADSYITWKTAFYHDSSSFFAKLNEQDNKEQLVLYLYIRMAVDTYGEYQKREIPDQIYYDTYKDFTIWFHCCVKKKGIPGLIEEGWLALPLLLRIFRLGRLQFEPDEMGGQKILHVHIPAGERLDLDACKQSFSQANDFFDASYTHYDCDSWLLSPNLSEVLEADSNIRKFQRLFTIEKVNYPYRQAEERIFGFITEDKSQYPEHTTLQKRVKAYVMAGKDLGIGHGIAYR